MPYKTGSWGEQAKVRSQKRKKYFIEYELTKRDSVKKIARKLLHLAISSGKLKSIPCEICGILPVEAHHDDYYEPLKVRWLCIKHHTLYHFPIRQCSQCDRIAKVKGMCNKHYMADWLMKK